MKRVLCVIFILLFSALLTSCKDDKELIDDKKEFENNINDIMNIIKNNDYDKNDFSSNYKKYYINNQLLYGHNYNYRTERMENNLFEEINTNITNALFAENLEGQLYASVENEKYCAIKEFESNDIKIYDISDEKECHKLYIDGKDIIVEIMGMEIEKNEDYEFSTISDGIISLMATSNLVDSKAVTYTWYRNNKEIENSNVKDYTITSNYEDADYYVEITTPTGDVYKSEPVNVKINREV